MKAAIRTFLLADTALAAAISGIYSFPAPQSASMETKPYLLLSRITEADQELIDSQVGFENELWQLDVLATTDKAAEAVKDLVKTRIYGMGGQTLSGFLVDCVTNVFVTDGSDLENLGGEAKVARKIIEFEMIRDEDTRT